MGSGFQRVAIYWAPAAGSALEQFGRTWLASDAGARECYGLAPDFVERAVASPRRYALHATLKAPFRLREGVSLEAVRSELAAFAGKRRRCRTGPLRLIRFSRYLALTAQPPAADLDWLAAECVTHFDRFRSPLSQEDRDRRAGHIRLHRASAAGEFRLSRYFRPLQIPHHAGGAAGCRRPGGGRSRAGTGGGAVLRGAVSGGGHLPLWRSGAGGGIQHHRALSAAGMSESQIRGRDLTQSFRRSARRRE